MTSAARVEEKTHATILDPRAVGGAAHGAGPSAICDLVMKGGITSGVIYPLVVGRLSDKYRFKNIGGTSAGAMAAAATAAAEHGRRSGQGTSFAGLKALPAFLGAEGHMLAMFRPEPSTRPIFLALLAAMRASGGAWFKFLAVIRSACRSYPLTCLLAAAPGLLIVALELTRGSVPWPFWLIGVLGGALLATAGAVLGPLGRLAHQFGSAVPANFYGLTTGCQPDGGDDYPLTNWLDRILNEVAGKPRHAPLTFGDLWTVGQPNPNVEHLRENPRERSIDLEVVSTCVSHGRPYRIPFEERGFYFDPVAWRRLFPAHVVDWMVAHQRPFEKGVDPDGDAVGPGGLKLCRLPSPENLPVVVAARMSLSFPILISAVPLYAVDYTREYNKRNSTTRPEGAPREAEVCWFSDGGISSNFPIHLFDVPFPRWPTFGVDLDEFPYDHAPRDLADMDRVEPYAVRLPRNNNEGWEPTWTRFDSGDALARIGGFIDAIRNAMMNWRDNTQSKLPGYRRRIVHIATAPWEGGYNLDMPPETIARLTQRGERAGDELAALDASWWDEHRWTRYRSAMALLETFLGQMPSGYRDGLSATPLSAIIARPEGTPPRAYSWGSPEQAAFGVEATRQLIELREGWNTQDERFAEGAPRPLPQLRIGPRV